MSDAVQCWTSQLKTRCIDFDGILEGRTCSSASAATSAAVIASSSTASSSLTTAAASFSSAMITNSGPSSSSSSTAKPGTVPTFGGAFTFTTLVLVHVFLSVAGGFSVDMSFEITGIR